MPFTAWRLLGLSHRERRKKGRTELTLLGVYGVSLSVSGLSCFSGHCYCSKQSCDFPFKLLRKEQSKVQLNVESLTL